MKLSSLLFSIIINTNGRKESLRRTIESLRALQDCKFELVVVTGPTIDGSQELVQSYSERGEIKAASCDELNLSKSRNIGIRAASGDIVAFVDDDAIPEPEWLVDLATAFETPEVVGAGGFTYDYTGYSFQTRYMLCDRFGDAELFDEDPGVDNYNFPLSARFPGLLGTNSAFRRKSLVEIGGFDEEYEYYLDETDVCCRLVDAGGQIKQLSNARVHHKFLPSHVRNEHRALSAPFPVLKSKVYFGFANNCGHHSTSNIIENSQRYFSMRHDDVKWCVDNGRLPEDALEQFDTTADRAWRVGLERGFSNHRRTRPPGFFANPLPFTPFPIRIALDEKRTFVFLSQSFPPTHFSGNARHTHAIAQGVAARGHTVHVITRSSDQDRVDLEDGVWIHRLVDKDFPPLFLPDGQIVPAGIANHALTALEEVERISSFRAIDAVESVSWDCESAAIVMDGRYAMATNIVTSFSHWLESHKDLENDDNWMSTFGRPMMHLEKYIFEHSDAIVAASRAIADSVAERYTVDLIPRTAFVPHGLIDALDLPRARPPSLAAEGGADRAKILFVGRLELRKGVDLVLAAAAELLQNPLVEFWFAGDDTLVLDGGDTAKQQFLDRNANADFLDRIHFLGVVSDEELRWLYANCDIFTSPSRFESFGLIFVEAMMFAKPSVGAIAGGVPEVLEHGVSGLLAPPDDAQALTHCLRRLIGDPALRAQFGARGRKIFEERFEVSVVAKKRVAELAAIVRRPVPETALQLPEGGKKIGIGRDDRDEGVLLPPYTAITLSLEEARILHATFWGHPWSGICEIRVNGELVREINLHRTSGQYVSVSVRLPERPAQIEIGRSGRKHADAHDTEVIFSNVKQTLRLEQHA